MNRRRYQRTPTQYFTKYAFINDQLSVETPPGFSRGVIENISFGGLSLILIPDIDPDIKKKLVNGKLNLYMDFNLPPSLRQIEITGKVKWVKEKEMNASHMSIIGVEFINKNKILFKEIDDFIKSDGKGLLLKNKRRFSRIPMSINVKFSVRKFKNVGFFSVNHDGFVRDISAGGMSVVVTPPLKKGHINSLLQRKKYLFLKFFLPGTNRFLNLTGVPTRIRNIKVKNKIVTLMGVRFINVPETDSHELIEFICHKRSCYVKENVVEEKSPSQKPELKK